MEKKENCRWKKVGQLYFSQRNFRIENGTRPPNYRLISDKEMSCSPVALSQGPSFRRPIEDAACNFLRAFFMPFRSVVPSPCFTDCMPRMPFKGRFSPLRQTFNQSALFLQPACIAKALSSKGKYLNLKNILCYFDIASEALHGWPAKKGLVCA